MLTLIFVTAVIIDIIIRIAIHFDEKRRQKEKVLAESIAQQRETTRLMEKFGEIDRRNEEAIRFAHAGCTAAEGLESFRKLREDWEEKERQYAEQHKEEE